MQGGKFQETSAATFSKIRIIDLNGVAAIIWGIPTSQYVASICQSHGPLIMPCLFFYFIFFEV